MSGPIAHPVRVRLSRLAGWKLPASTIVVTRATKWGNPFPIGREGPLGRIAPDAAGAVGFFRAMLSDPEMRPERGYPGDARFPSTFLPLRGYNLACWCKLGAPCHADVLLELANAVHPTSPAILYSELNKNNGDGVEEA